MNKQPIQRIPFSSRAMVVAWIWVGTFLFVLATGLWSDDEGMAIILQISFLLSAIGGAMVLADIQNRIVAVMTVSPLIVSLLLFAYYALADIFF